MDDVDFVDILASALFDGLESSAGGHNIKERKINTETRTRAATLSEVFALGKASAEDTFKTARFNGRRYARYNSLQEHFFFHIQ